MIKLYLSIDIGASSGRHIVGWLEGGAFQTKEVYRFPNGVAEQDGRLTWDVVELMFHVKHGIDKALEQFPDIASFSIDTWGCDYVLLRGDEEVWPCHAYRDNRTETVIPAVHEKVPFAELYAHTGCQFQPFNTVYQLCDDLGRGRLEGVTDFLMAPEYLLWKLTGVKAKEYTNATTSQLVSPITKDWDYELIDMLGYNSKMFLPVSMPGTVVGNFTKEIQEEVGFDCTVVLPATHDTGSAVLAVPTNNDNAIYISSGTWSLMGIERKEADCSMASMQANFTNEGGYDHRFRFLKNIMGLWMIQSVKKEFEEDLSFGEICERASKEKIASIVDCNDNCFFAPKSMIRAVQDFCANTNQQVPRTVGEISAVVYNSLAYCYGETVKEIEAITGNTYDTIYVVGGGANAGYLNELTAKHTGKKVSAGPTEATAIGNIAVQMLQDGVFADLTDVRNCIKKSFNIKYYM